MNSLLDRMKLWQKFALLTALGILMCLVPLGIYLRDYNAQIESTRAELSAIGPMKQLANVERVVLTHRGTTRLVLNGQAEASRLQGLQREMQADWASVDQIGRAHV